MLVLALALAADAHVPQTIVVFESDDWCSIIQAGYTGDLYLFGPGTYQGPCIVTGPPPDQYGERLYMESFYDQDGLRAVFQDDGVEPYILQVEGFDVSIRAIEIAAVSVDAIRMAGDGHVVERVVTQPDFTGTFVRQTGDLTGLWLEECVIEGQGHQAVILGCPGCTSEGTVVLENRIVGASVGIRGTDGAVGDIQENTVQAASAMDWAAGSGTATEMERNFVVSDDVGVRLSGGDVQFRNNVVVADSVALHTSGPGSHGVYGNTLYTGAGDAVTASWSGVGLDYRNNAHTGSAPTEGLVDGNVDCTPDLCDCWTDPENWEFYPAPSSPLVSAGVELPFGALEGDFCNRPRTDDSAGAFDFSKLLGPGPLDLGMPNDRACLLPPDPDPDDPSIPCQPVGTGTGTGSGTGTVRGHRGASGPEEAEERARWVRVFDGSGTGGIPGDRAVDIGLAKAKAPHLIYRWAWIQPSCWSWCSSVSVLPVWASS